MFNVDPLKNRIVGQLVYTKKQKKVIKFKKKRNNNGDKIKIKMSL